MPAIGLTGGIASGKSTVSRMLAAKGAHIIDADEIVHELMSAGGRATEAIEERFGRDILDEEGAVDRRKLGAIVFSDTESRKDLEGIVHPLVFERIVEGLAAHADAPLVVVDAALLVETVPDRGRSLGLDAVVVVTTSPEEQMSRLIQGRSMSHEDATARISAQAPDSHKLARADYVIFNRGSLEELQESVDTLWKELQGLA